MSIIVIIVLSVLVGALVGLISSVKFWVNEDFKPAIITLVIVALAIAVGGTLLGIGLTTEDERVFVAQYESQKTTIETSINSDILTGAERVALVTKAAELNGELATRKTLYDRWHHVTFDSTIYDDVEFIKFD